MKTLVIILLLALVTACSSNHITRSVAGNNLVPMVADQLATMYINGDFDREVIIVVETEYLLDKDGNRIKQWFGGYVCNVKKYKPWDNRYPELIMESSLSDADKKRALADRKRILNEK